MFLITVRYNTAQKIIDNNRQATNVAHNKLFYFLGNDADKVTERVCSNI